jgi:hypothetical protein
MPDADLRDTQHRTALARTCSALEEFVASGHLGVRGILDLEPVGARAVRMVPTARELAHDALKIVRAGHRESCGLRQAALPRGAVEFAAPLPSFPNARTCCAHPDLMTLQTPYGGFLISRAAES